MDDNKNPLELPDNNPQSETQPIKANTSANELKHKKRMKAVKIAYAFAVVIAFGAALTAKIATEKALGNINVPIEHDYVTIPTEAPTQADFEVRQNVTNVPDTRENETEAPTEQVKEKITENEVTELPETPYAKPYKDYFNLPLNEEILKDYSPDAPVYNSTMNYWKTHTGIDFKAADGAQIKAIAYGIVKSIYTDSLLGTVVEIDHGNDVVAKYCGFNNDTLQVKKGDSVNSGSLLGYLGIVPFEKTDLPHLHFEIIYQGKNVDPLELMGK